MVFRQECISRAPRGVTRAATNVERLVTVATPYRLDLTVAVLRRFSTNIVDVVGANGAYARALAGFASPVIVTVRQREAAAIAVDIVAAPGEEARAFALVQRMLGTQRTLERFDRGAREITWLRALAARMRGVKPPRYPSLWEACVNAVVFQQISLIAASAMLRRTIVALGEPVSHGDLVLYAFPEPGAFLSVAESELRAAGLSAAKVATLRRIADALLGGALDEAMLEERASADAVTLLCGIKGIGPWTAAVILLRGLGRLDVFPMNDSGVARSVAALAGGGVDVAAALEVLGDERGMLYYHLLLSRLEARGDL